MALTHNREDHEDERKAHWWACEAGKVVGKTNKQANKQEIIKELPSWIKRKTI